jgi:hypothetical protein
MRPYDLEGATRTRTLSSNAIFMGILISPRAAHLLSAPGSNRDAVDGGLEEIELELAQMFRRSLNARELELQVQAIAAHVGANRPRGRAPTSFLVWLRDNWREANAIVLREFLGHTEWITRDDSTQYKFVRKLKPFSFDQFLTFSEQRVVPRKFWTQDLLNKQRTRCQLCSTGLHFRWPVTTSASGYN